MLIFKGAKTFEKIIYTFLHFLNFKLNHTSKIKFEPTEPIEPKLDISEFDFKMAYFLSGTNNRIL